MYKKLKGSNGQDLTTVILRIADGANIPNDPGNRDWIEYQTWLTQGNTPLPSDN